jgi:hypothetical protein
LPAEDGVVEARQLAAVTAEVEAKTTAAAVKTAASSLGAEATRLREQVNGFLGRMRIA